MCIHTYNCITTGNCVFFFCHVGWHAKAYFCGVRFVYNEKLRQLLSSMQLLLLAHISIKFSTLSCTYSRIVCCNITMTPQRIYIFAELLNIQQRKSEFRSTYEVIKQGCILYDRLYVYNRVVWYSNSCHDKTQDFIIITGIIYKRG